MRATGILVGCTLVLAIGTWLIVSGWRQPRPALDTAMRHLHRRPARVGPATESAPGFARVGRLLDGTGRHLHTAHWELPLRLIGRSVEVHMGMLVTASLVGFMAPTLVLSAGSMAGLISIGWIVPAALSLASGLVAPMLVHADALARADDVRLDLRHQLGAFIDMVTMLLAGNSGHEGALEHAARAGDGLLFRQLRRRMREVATTGRSLVEALSMVAQEYGIVELEQVAATARLSANEGAPVARSLAAKCATLRNTLAAEDEANARIRNDKVTPPLVGMALLFMALIIYPALELT